MNGDIAFSTDNSGVFAQSSCTPVQGANPPGTASCSVQYIPDLGSEGAHHIGASYGGDEDHSSAVAVPFALTATVRSTSTSVVCSPSPVAVNAPTTCTATVTDTDAGAAITPTGIASFSTDGGLTSRFTPASCSLLPISSEASSCRVSYSPALGTEATHKISASYGGDTDHAGSLGTFALTAIKATPSITTLVSSSGMIVIGGSATGTATLSGGANPTGTITFTIYSDSGCAAAFSATGFPSSVSATGSNGVQPSSASFTPASAGPYYWNAVYSGDVNNKAATSSCEALTVTAASPTITTTAAPSSVTLGTTAPTLSDSATLSGGYHETGTITFTLYYASSCGGTHVDTETVSTVSGDGTYSTPTGYTLPTSGTVTGTYEWVASYGGDTNNGVVSTTCGAESATVSNASPSIGTTVSNSGAITIGGSATDQGTFSNAYGTLTGTLVFSAYTSSSCSGGLSFTSGSIAVSGNGPYTSSSFPPSAPGTYYWQATFTDTDGNNNGFTTACGGSGETLDVQRPRHFHLRHRVDRKPGERLHAVRHRNLRLRERELQWHADRNCGHPQWRWLGP